MQAQRRFRGLLILSCALAAGFVLGSGTSVAAELSDFRWERRPLLVFAPAESDPRLAETLNHIEATRCDFISRDMVVGRVVTDGASTLDGHVIDADQSQRLRSQFAIGENSFTVLLIGKDGGVKRRVNEVPDLQAIYALIDGMPMRGSEMAAGSSGC